MKNWLLLPFKWRPRNPSYRKKSRPAFREKHTIETFRFENENDYENDINLKFFRAYSQKIDTPESFNVLFVIRTDSTVIYVEGG